MPESLQNFLLFVAILFIFTGCASTASSPDSSEPEQTITGMITVQSPGSFIIPDAAGKEIRFLTGRKTQYLPPHFRSDAGDTVTVTYRTRNVRGKQVNQVSNLMLVSPDPDRREISSPVQGDVAEAGVKWFKITVPGHPDSFTFEKDPRTQYSPEKWRPESGDLVTIHFRKIPSRFSNSYVYLVDRFIKDNRP